MSKLLVVKIVLLSLKIHSHRPYNSLLPTTQAVNTLVL